MKSNVVWVAQVLYLRSNNSGLFLISSPLAKHLAEAYPLLHSFPVRRKCNCSRTTLCLAILQHSVAIQFAARLPWLHFKLSKMNMFLATSRLREDLLKAC